MFCQHKIKGLLVAIGLALSPGLVLAQSPATPETSRSSAPAAHSPVFAVINGRVVTTQEYETAFASLVRNRFYHGQVPEAELAAAREELKVRLVQRVVLIDEARRRGIQPDEAQIAAALEGYDRRYAARPEWAANREAILAGVREQLVEQSLVAGLEQSIRDALPAPSPAEVRAFYDRNPELFTEPEKFRVSLILLRVDPGSPATGWESTRAEARAIHARLLAGADFADTARLHSQSGDEAGGDLGYVHRGMLPSAIQTKVDSFEIGKVNEPIDVLEGVAIVRLDERTAPRKRAFEDVAVRARELLVRQRGDQAWKSLVEGLVAKADVKFMHAANLPSGDANRN